MDHHDSSQRQFANPYSTPQQAQYGSTQGWNQFSAHQTPAGSAQTTPRYTTTPSQTLTGSGSTPLAAPASFGSVHLLEQSPTGFPGSGRASDAGVYYAQTHAPAYNPTYTPSTQSLQYPTDSPSSGLHHPSGSQAERPRFAPLAYDVSQGRGQTAHVLPQPAYGSQHQPALRTHSAPHLFAIPAHYQQPVAANQYVAQYDPRQTQILSSPLQFSHLGISTTTPSAPQPFMPAAPEPTSNYAPYPSQTQFPQEPAQGLLEQASRQVDAGRRDYELHLATVFREVSRDNLRGLDEHLLAAAGYLLGNIEALGLHLDHEDPNDERNRTLREERAIEWTSFNRAWLTTLQAQFDLTQNMLQTNQTPSVMDARTLTRLAEELIRLSDGAERFGLVDYEAGVAEEEIIDMIIRCLDQLPEDVTPGDDGAPAESSSAALSRARQTRR